MDRKFGHCLTLLFVLLFSSRVFTDEPVRDTLYKKIYKTVNMLDACVRLTNATHQIGCSSPSGGNVGTVEFVDDSCNTSRVTSSGRHPPYVAVIGIHCFNSHVMYQFIKYKKRVAGVIINGTNHNNLDFPGDNSPGLQCPNGQFGMYNNSCDPTWNPEGTRLAYESVPFPVFILDFDNIEIIHQCYLAFNVQEDNSFESYPLCKVNMESFMYSARDTPTCMNREKVFFTGRTCDPLGGHEITGCLLNGSNPNRDGATVFLAAKMDSSAFFHDLVFGAENDVSGMVVVMAALEAMGELKRNGQLNANHVRPIVFAFFNGTNSEFLL